MATIFKGYNVGLKYTLGAPAGTTPVPTPQTFFAGKNIAEFADAAVLHKCCRELGEHVQRTTQLIAQTPPPGGAGLRWVPITTIQPFLDAIYDDV